MANKGNVRIRLWRYIQRNDVVLHIFTSFAFVLALTGGLIGCIFVSLYQKNYVNSYTKLLTRQGKIISKRVANFENKQKETLFQKYSVYIDEMQMNLWRRALSMRMQIGTIYQKKPTRY